MLAAPPLGQQAYTTLSSPSIIIIIIIITSLDVGFRVFLGGHPGSSMTTKPCESPAAHCNARSNTLSGTLRCTLTNPLSVTVPHKPPGNTHNVRSTYKSLLSHTSTLYITWPNFHVKVCLSAKVHPLVVSTCQELTTHYIEPVDALSPVQVQNIQSTSPLDNTHHCCSPIRRHDHGIKVQWSCRP